MTDAWWTEDWWNLLVYVARCYRIFIRQKITQCLHETSWVSLRGCLRPPLGLPSHSEQKLCVKEFIWMENPLEETFFEEKDNWRQTPWSHIFCSVFHYLGIKLLLGLRNSANWSIFQEWAQLWENSFSPPSPLIPSQTKMYSENEAKWSKVQEGEKSWHNSFSDCSWPRNQRLITRTSGKRTWDEEDVSEWSWASHTVNFCRKIKEGMGN